MLSYTKEQAIYASEQFISGLARFAECFIEEGAGARLLGVDQLTPKFEYLTLDPEGTPYQDFQSSDRYEFPRAIATLYDFADSGYARSKPEIEEVLSDGFSFWEVFEHGAHFVDRMGEDLVDPEHIQVLDTVYKAALARSMILGDDFLGSDLVPIENLAALAGVSVKTLRNAATNSGKSKLKTQKSGAKTVVEPNDALEWLRTRPGFKETRIDDRPIVQKYSSVHQLGIHLATLCEWKGETPKTLGSKASLTDAQTNELVALVGSENFDLLEKLDAGALAQVATVLGFDNPKEFVIEAIQPIGAYNAVRIAESELA